MMLSIVDLPHPEGPTRQRNSPFATSRLMFCSTGVVLPSRMKTMLRFSARSLMLVAGVVAAADIF